MANGTTFQPINFDRKDFLACAPAELVGKIETRLEELRNQRLGFYKDRLRNSSANRIRRSLVFLASAASFLTACAAVIRITNVETLAGKQLDIGLFAVAFLFYALMGALLIAEKTGDISSRYFRALATILAIRDLSTKLQFSLLDLAFEGQQLSSESDAALKTAFRKKVFAVAEAFCTDLGKLTREELQTWQNEYTTSISELDTLAQQGKTSVEQSISEAITELKSARDQAKQEAAAEEAAKKPALVKVTVKTAFDGEIRVAVENVETAKFSQTSFALNPLPTGATKIEAFAEKDGKSMSYSDWVELKPGIQALDIDLT